MSAQGKHRARPHTWSLLIPSIVHNPTFAITINKVTMKKIIAASMLAMAVPAVSQAQEGFKFGIKAGLNMFTVISSDEMYYEEANGTLADQGFKLGPHAGVGLHLGFGRHGNSSLLVDALFSMKGHTSKYTYNDVDANGDSYQVDAKEVVTRMCLDVPIMFRFRANWGMYSEIGLYTSFALATTIRNDDPYMDAFYLAVEEESYRPLDLGILAGAGWISNGGIGIGLRGSVGFLDQYKKWDNPNDPFDLSDAGMTWNFGVQLCGMYYFGWDN